ncbi:MAG: hypothetical protein N3E47_05020 [Candidatus Bathyarchaeota archaeon]|nr:hypothetical protein [Candidatus Bathyarchaeota archaeon]
MSDEKLRELKEYYKNISSGRIIPKDPFSLSYTLLTPEDFNVLAGDLAEKQVLLSFLGDDMMISLYQNDIDILTRMRNMALRDEKLLSVFLTLYFSWLGTLKLTRAKDGLERKMQASAVGYQPPGMQLSEGFGNQFAEELRQAEEDAKRNNPLSKLLSKFKKR